MAKYENWIKLAILRPACYFLVMAPIHVLMQPEFTIGDLTDIQVLAFHDDEKASGENKFWAFLTEMFEESDALERMRPNMGPQSWKGYETLTGSTGVRWLVRAEKWGFRLH